MERREFIKTAGLTGAGVTAGALSVSLGKNMMNDLVQGGKSVSRTTGVTRIPVPSTCLLCDARCGITGYLEDNILVKIEGNPRDPNSRGKMCAIGIAGFQSAYNPDRLLKPLKRVGKRGENKWQEISWNEALTTVADKIKKVRSSGDTHKMIFLNNADQLPKLTQQFVDAIGKLTYVNMNDLYTLNEKHVLHALFGVDTIIPDLANSKFILNFGGNPYESNDHFVPLISRLIDSRMTGTRFITFDPRISNTSGKSDEWYPINPSSDMIIALAMVNVILSRGLYNGETISKWLNISLQELVHIVSKFTPEMAQNASGIKEAHIRRLAIEFASAKHACAIYSGGVYQQKDGAIALLSVMLLNIVTGNIDSPGGMCIPQYIGRSLRTKDSDIAPQKLFHDLFDKKVAVDLLISSKSNPAFVNPDPMLVETVLKDETTIPFHVAVECYMTETANFADIVLPTTSYLESWGLHSVASYELTPLVLLQQPIVKPRGESKQIHYIMVELAKLMGEDFKNKFGTEKVEKFIRSEVEKVASEMLQSGGFENLKEVGVWDEMDVQKYGWHKKSDSASDKSDLNAMFADMIKVANMTIDDISDSEKKPDEFDLILYKSAVQKADFTAECMWLSEIEHENFIWINKGSAQKLGIKNGENIMVLGPKTSVRGKARYTNGIHPNAIAMNKNLGHWGYGKISRNEAFVSKDPNTAIIWWSEMPAQPHPMRLIVTSSDNFGKGQQWNNQKVRIEKI
ncbi:MAG: molybdopterin-dependent oxidoreductase [Candidatus Kapabacteria bacterium]|nr:molybdopterin-dependent oxidoreductase [Candidatus Kapabacteria bacterium]